MLDIGYTTVIPVRGSRHRRILGRAAGQPVELNQQALGSVRDHVSTKIRWGATGKTPEVNTGIHMGVPTHIHVNLHTYTNKGIM